MNIHSLDYYVRAPENHDFIHAKVFQLLQSLPQGIGINHVACIKPNALGMIDILIYMGHLYTN